LGNIPPLELRSNPKLAEHSHEGESEVYKIPEFITSQSDTELLLQMEFEFRKVLQSSSAVEKINDSLATKQNVMMKPVHDINHILRHITSKQSHKQG
jgi:hypothetical protein